MLLRPVLFLGRTRVVNPGKDASYTPKIPLRAYQGKSRYAWAFLPDLRGSRVQPGTQDEEQKVFMTHSTQPHARRSLLRNAIGFMSLTRTFWRLGL